jgi:hypothetical protein
VLRSRRRFRQSNASISVHQIGTDINLILLMLLCDSHVTVKPKPNGTHKMPEPARQIGGAILFGIIFAAAAPVFVAVFTADLLFGRRDAHPVVAEDDPSPA